MQIGPVDFKLLGRQTLVRTQKIILFGRLLPQVSKVAEWRSVGREVT